MGTTATFASVTLESHPDAPCDEPVEAFPGLWTATPYRGWADVARWYSIRQGGQWWPKATGATWCLGRRIQWLVEPHCVAPIVEARGIVQSFGSDCGYSIGSAARALLKYIGHPQYHYKNCLLLTSETGPAYVDCTPGQYPDAAMYDCKSYYYAILKRLPTWRLSLTSAGKLQFHGNYVGEEDRREQVLRAVGGHKLLRNALVGCMCGRSKGQPYYFRGRQLAHRGGPGLYRGAGLLVRRVAWELTQRASLDTDSKLSNTDCVLTSGGLYPGVWDDLGLVVSRLYEGDADVCCPVIYKVGAYETHWYERGSRFRQATPRPALPELSYVGSWMRRSA